mmetsp:Transcript_20350/g.29968  ORF Transcript_20350/g.29968 Transcript_20350/m.29968 type:complete len:90 (-) Transcript_20350:125-394(-)
MSLLLEIVEASSFTFETLSIKICINRGNTPPSTTYATPRRGGTNQLEQNKYEDVTVASLAAAAAAAASVGMVKDGHGMDIGAIPYVKRH